MKTAVLYLRVSTVGQVETDYDPEGISIPAQRDSCRRKAEAMGVRVIDEYVEPGRSATSIEKRPVFQQMLERLRTERDVDYVIVYKLSRLNRNRVDDAKVLMLMRALKVSLVSATESIDETPVGQLMHGILASFNEFRSAEDGADIRYKMGQKAKNGGTITKAPIGYVNVREVFDGREIRTVVPDPDRADLIRLAFELYATGEYSVDTLRAKLTELGLRTRGNRRYAGGPVSANRLWSTLRDPYYMGKIAYEGLTYPGRHEALVSEELFARVQTVLDTNRASGERRRVHKHYLKGTLYCARCHEQGRESRMLIQRTVNRHGAEYLYFFCRGRQERLCEAPHVAVVDLEAAVLRNYAALQLSPDFTGRVRALMEETLADQTRGQRAVTDDLAARLKRLDVREDNLLDLAADGEMPKERVRAKIAAIRDEREQLKHEQQRATGDLQLGAQVLYLALDLLSDPQELYRQAGDQTRRIINQAFFERLYVEGPAVREEQLNEPFSELLFMRRRRHYSRAKPGRPVIKRGLLERALCEPGSSKTLMVGC